jgi:hypothetical protein
VIFNNQIVKVEEQQFVSVVNLNSEQYIIDKYRLKYQEIRYPNLIHEIQLQLQGP